MRVTGKKSASVSEMLRDLGDAGHAEGFEKYQNERRVVTSLRLMRCVSGLSQAELAERMGCGQSKISKVESSTDADLSLGDMIAFASSLGQSVRFEFFKGTSTAAERLRFHAICLVHEAETLVKLAGEERTIGDGVESFALRMLQNMIVQMFDVIDQLPHRAARKAPPVIVDAQGDRGERLPLDQPLPARRATVRKATKKQPTGA